jgi:hypothetical protein
MATDKRILKDLDEVKEMIQKIKAGELPNYTVRDPDYISPTITSPVLPLEAKEGLLHYYQSIREAIEQTLHGKKIPARLMPLRAPDYLLALQE